MVYFYAESKGRKTFIDRQDETIRVQREELRDWQNKALFRNQLSPLGRETEPQKPRPESEKNLMPRVAMRSARAARAEGNEPNQAITIHGHEVSNPRLQDTLDKAKKIKQQAEITASD